MLRQYLWGSRLSDDRVAASPLRVVGTALVICFGALAGAPAASAQDRTSAVDGIFTAEQGVRGQELVEEVCAECHGDRLQGDEGDVPAIAGARFMILANLSQLFSMICEEMPEDNTGSLSQQQCVDVIAYFLQRNGYPAGNAELPPDAALLRSFYVSPLPR